MNWPVETSLPQFHNMDMTYPDDHGDRCWVNWLTSDETFLIGFLSNALGEGTAHYVIGEESCILGCNSGGGIWLHSGRAYRTCLDIVAASCGYKLVPQCVVGYV